MIFLVDFSPIKPDFGLFFWTVIIFVLFWMLIGKYAFKPIADSLSKRENDIQHALDEAKRARQEMEQLKSANEELLAQARQERAQILREAKETKDSIVKQAKTTAKEEASKVLANAQMEIENQKKRAIAEIKEKTGSMAIDIAERILREKLADKDEQRRLVNELVNDINLS